MNEVVKNIYERRAVRKYKKTPVPKSMVEQVLSAGQMAPSAMNRQPWKFYILTDKEQIISYSKEILRIATHEIKHLSIKEAVVMTLSFFHFSNIKKMLQGDDHLFYGAPVVILITSAHDDEWGALDIGMCAQNIMLAAKSMGLDTCPVGFAKFISKTKDYHLLNIPSSEQVQLAIVLGYGDEKPAPHERKTGNITYL